MRLSTDMNALATFAKVVEDESFTIAAEHLGLSKATVSKRISRLEEDLGVRLLHRDTRGLRLSDAGEIYYKKIRRILDDLEDANQVVSAHQTEPTGRLRVAFRAHLLPPRLGVHLTEYLRDHRGVRLEVRLPRIPVDVLTDDFDVVIETDPVDDSPYMSTVLGEIPTCLVASPAYLEDHPAPREPGEIHQHACLLFGGNAVAGSSTWRFADETRRAEVRVSGRFIADDLHMLREAAAAGAGLALLPRHVCAETLCEGGLEEIALDLSPASLRVIAVYSDHRLTTPKVRTFLDHLAASFPEALRD